MTACHGQQECIMVVKLFWTEREIIFKSHLQNSFTVKEAISNTSEKDTTLNYRFNLRTNLIYPT